MPQTEHGRSKIGGWPLAAAVAIVLVFLFFDRYVLLPFVLAAAVGFLLSPLTDWLHRHGHLRRWVAGVCVYIGFIIAAGLLLIFIGGPMVKEAAELIQKLPQTLHTLLVEGAKFLQHETGQPIDVDAIAATVQKGLQAFLNSGVLLSFAGYGMATLAGSVLFLVLLIYFLVSGKRIAEGIFWLVPPEYRQEVRRVAAKITPMLWRYFLGLAVIVIYASSIAWLGFQFVFHLPHAGLLAVVVGVLELVPIVGPALSIALVVLTALQQTSIGAIIGTVGLAVALRISIDELVGPLVLGEAARVHPIVIIFSLLSGAVLFGALGLLLAVPFAASLKIVLGIYYSEPVTEESSRS